MPMYPRFVALLSLISTILPVAVWSHVAENEGKTLQMYSYFTTTPPKINGCLTDGTTNGGTITTQGLDNDEWKDAYIRKIQVISMDNTDTIDGTLFFMNDNTSLYIGVTTNFNNSSNNTYIEFAFDQGIGGGNHNDLIEGGGTGSNNGEYAARVYPNKGIAVQKLESSFDGTSWVQQNNGTEVFSGYGRNFGSSFVQAEFRIPLNGNPAAGDNQSFLDVTGTSELGVYISFFAQGGSVYYRWPETNGSITDAATSPGWIDLKLGVDRSYATFYSTFNANGNPTIDGNITGAAIPDDAWRGAYRRNLTLTNFAGSTLDAILYAVDDNTGNNFYIGLKILDNDNDAGDYCQIYQEQDLTGPPATGRNYLLDNGRENSLIADENAFSNADDLYWNLNAWAADGSATAQNARGAWYSSGSFYEYEFLVDRNNVENEDLFMADGSLMGFNIKYHDASGSGTDYFWEYAPNSDTVRVDLNADVFVAAGWPDLQMGAPYVQVIYPEDASTIEGVANIRIYARDEGADEIDSAFFYRKSVPGTKYSLTRIAGTDEWSGTWDVSSLPNGADTLVFEVGDNDGIVVQRLCNLTIANGTGASTPPTVSITSPTAGSTVNGDVTITFTAAATGGTIVTREVSIDGAAYSATTTTTTHTWSTGALTEGNHTVQLKITDSNGKSTTTNAAVYIVKNSPAVTLTAPAADLVVSGTVAVTFVTTPVSPATISSTAIAIDGGPFTATSSGTTDTLDTQTLTEGAHTVQIRATDSNGKTALSELRKFVVKNSPLVTLTAPAADSTTAGTVVVTFTATAVAPATIAATAIAIDGGPFTATSSGTTDTLDTQTLTEGAHTVQIRATDSNGKTALSELRKFVVKNSPLVTLTAPAADSTIAGTVVVTFTATAVAPATIAATAIAIDGGPFTATALANADTLDTQLLTEGAHTVQIKVTDSNSKAGLSEQRKFVVRNNPTVSLVYPAADTLASGTITVQFSAQPVAPATIKRREIFIDGTLLDTSNTDSTFAWNTVNHNDGQHTVQVRTVDSNNKKAVSDIVTVTLFNTPVVEITKPVDSIAIDGIDTIAFTVAYAPGTSRDTTEISFNGGAWVPSTNLLSHTWISTDFRDGIHTVQVRARATNGKTGVSPIRTYEVSNAPTATITAPAPGEALSGNYPVRFEITPVSPATISKQQVSIDGGPWLDSLVDDSSFTMNTAGWKNGTHSLQVRGIDDHNRIGYSHTRSFIVDNEAPLAADPKAVYGEKTTTARSGTSVLITVLVKDNLVGLKSDSAVVLTSASIAKDATTTYIMSDDGTMGDKVKGDNVYTAQVEVSTDSTGSIDYSITTVDKLGNDTTIASAIMLDNTDPQTGFTLDPLPKKGSDIRSGTTYFRTLVMKGTYSDKGGAGLARVFIGVHNDSGSPVNNSPVVLAPEDSLFSRIIELIPGTNRITLVAIDKAGNGDSTIGTVVYQEPKATKIIDRKGGTVDNPDGASVAVPKDALLGKVEVTIVPVDPVDERKPLNSTLKLLNAAHDFGPDGTTFRKPVALTLPYTEANLDLDQNGIRDIDPTKLVIVFWDGGTWRTAGPGTVDTVAQTVTVEVNHFTIYDLAVSTATTTTKLQVFWSANPVDHQTGSYFTYNVPSNGSVSCRIVDMTGDLVYQLIPEKTPVRAGTIQSPIVWRGQNTAGRFAGAGLYVYVFSFKPDSGGTPAIIRKPIGLLYAKEGR